MWRDSPHPSTSSTPARPRHAVLDDPAFAGELERVVPPLRAYARVLSRSADRGDDLVQDALLKAWAARRSFRKGTNFKAWIFTILRNTHLTAMRRRKFEGEYHEGAEEGLAAPPNQLDHLSLVELRQALTRLPPKQCESLMLVVAAGFSYAEAAEICGCMVGTIKSRIGRARETLQRILDGTEAGPGDRQDST